MPQRNRTNDAGLKVIQGGASQAQQGHDKKYWRSREGKEAAQAKINFFFEENGYLPTRGELGDAGLIPFYRANNGDNVGWLKILERMGYPAGQIDEVSRITNPAPSLDRKDFTSIHELLTEIEIMGGGMHPDAITGNPMFYGIFSRAPDGFWTSRVGWRESVRRCVEFAYEFKKMPNLKEIAGTLGLTKMASIYSGYVGEEQFMAFLHSEVNRLLPLYQSYMEHKEHA